MEAKNLKPHAVCVPFPFQGHITPMLKFAKLLHHKGFNVTFLNTEPNHNRLIESNGQASLASLPGFRFAAIPDSVPNAADLGASLAARALCKSICENFLAPFLNLIASLDNDKEQENGGPVTCIVSDFLMTKFTVLAAEELRMPIALFSPFNATVIMALRQFRAFKNRGLVPFKDSSYLRDEVYLNSTIDWIPGIKEIRIRDLPTMIRTIDENEFIFHFMMESVELTPKDSTIIFHSVEALEEDVLGALSSYFPHMYTVAPLDLLLKQIPEDATQSMTGSLWVEDNECLEWLDGLKPNSVIYVNFGSITVMTPQQMVEFGWGLANSKHPFLWVIRPDLVIGESAMLPKELMEETSERGKVVSWCPQEKVLNHPSIGGFWTHCGWNSTIESICAGVPLLCWPFYGDAPTYCWLSCEVWEIGIEVNNNAKRDELEKLVRELMEGEKGKVLKKNVMELRNKCLDAISPGGSSATNLDKLVKRLSDHQTGLLTIS